MWIRKRKSKWNRPIRISHSNQVNEWGITGRTVGAGGFGWSPWLQLHFGGLCIQVSHWMLPIIGLAVGFILGFLAGRW